MSSNTGPYDLADWDLASNIELRVHAKYGQHRSNPSDYYDGEYQIRYDNMNFFDFLEEDPNGDMYITLEEVIKIKNPQATISGLPEVTETTYKCSLNPPVNVPVLSIGKPPGGGYSGVRHGQFTLRVEKFASGFPMDEHEWIYENTGWMHKKMWLDGKRYRKIEYLSKVYSPEQFQTLITTEATITNWQTTEVEEQAKVFIDDLELQLTAKKVLTPNYPTKMDNWRGGGLDWYMPQPPEWDYYNNSVTTPFRVIYQAHNNYFSLDLIDLVDLPTGWKGSTTGPMLVADPDIVNTTGAYAQTVSYYENLTFSMSVPMYYAESSLDICGSQCGSGKYSFCAKDGYNSVNSWTFGGAHVLDIEQLVFDNLDAWVSIRENQLQALVDQGDFPFYETQLIRRYHDIFQFLMKLDSNCPGCLLLTKETRIMALPDEHLDYKYEIVQRPAYFY